MNDKFGPETSYCEDDLCCLENIPYGEDERHLLDLYLPAENCGTKNLCLVLYIHGGAWIGGDKSAYSPAAKSLTQKFLGKGLAAATIGYRYLSEKVNMRNIIDDVQAAVECIKRVAEEKGFNFTKMMLTGHSAGAHLALIYAYSRAHCSAIEPALVAAYAAPTDFNDTNYFNENELDDDTLQRVMSCAIGQKVTKENGADFKDDFDEISPVHYVCEKTVPTIINHGRQDKIVPFSNALTLKNKLSQYGVEHIFNVYENSGHGLEKDKEADEKAFADMLCYINKFMIDKKDNYL